MQLLNVCYDNPEMLLLRCYIVTVLAEMIKRLSKTLATIWLKNIFERWKEQRLLLGVLELLMDCLIIMAGDLC